MNWYLFVVASSCALASFGAIAARADTSQSVAQSSKPPKEVVLCDTGMSRIPVKAGERLCPDGHKVRRTLLIPGNVSMTEHVKGADGRNYETWGIFMSILLTDEGLMFWPPPSNLRRSDIHADTVTLHAGWPGLYEFELDRAVDGLTRMPWGDDARRRIKYAWSNDRDPDFRVFEAHENTDETGLTPLLLPTVLVPKDGGLIFFQCVGPALYKGKPTDPLCAVHDSTDPEGDQLSYNLRYSRLREWRRYSTWLWNYVSSITIRESAR